MTETEVMAATAPPAGSTRVQPGGRLVVILGLLSTFGPLSMDMYLPGLPSLTSDLHTTASTANLTLTGCMLGIAFGQFVSGPISDKLGRRGPVLVGVGGYAAASAVCAFAPSIWPLIVVRFIQGFAGGAGIVIARAVVRDVYEGVAAARMFATLIIIGSVAPVIAPLLGGQILNLTSWRGVFAVLAGIGLVMATMTAVWLPETLASADRHGGGLAASVRTIAKLARDRRFAPYAVAFALSFGAMFAYIAGSSYVLENVFNASPQVFSVVFAVNACGFIAGSQVGSRLVGRVGPATLVTWGLFGVAASSVLGLIVTTGHLGLWPLLIALFGLLSFNGVVMPNAIAAAMTGHEPSELGAASGLIGVGQFGLGAVLAPLVGLAGTHNAVPMGVVMGVCGVSALLVDLAFDARH
jgi:MFS transporter, DHA1 family, multidrug resistance protein